MTGISGGKRIIFSAALLLAAALPLPGRVLPDCVHAERSQLVFPASREAQDRFYARLDSLCATGQGNVNIWHVGGSHVQAAFFPNRIMRDIDSVALRGDRGFLFPRRLCKTNSDKSYNISSTGEWEAPMLTRNSKLKKPRYGITGFGARTSDPSASVSFNVSPDADSLWSFGKLRVLGYASSDRVVPRLVSGADTLECRVDEYSAYLFDLPQKADSVTLILDIPEGESFTLNGFYPMSGRPGVNYFASGVNGAKVTSWMDQCEDLERDLGMVKPDLAILALGINDSACKAKDFSPEKFKNNYRRLISLIHKVSPDCALIFITNNDSYRYISRGMTYNMNAAAVRQAMMELAAEYGAAVWDLYGVMGEAHSVEKWLAAGLAKPDRLHFTDEGYTLLGDLFFEALMKDKNSAAR
jgi:lysophospholipase L1-like esterase